jgi:hypothetical protein
MRVALKYGAALIAIYLIVYNGSNSGVVLNDGANGVATVTKALQGRG